MAQLEWNESIPQTFNVAAGDGRLVVTGELDLATAPHFEEMLRQFVESRNGDDVVIDARDLTFLDSSGLAVLAATAVVLAATGRHLVLQRPPPFVCRLLEITGLAPFLHFDQSESTDTPTVVVNAASKEHPEESF